MSRSTNAPEGVTRERVKQAFGFVMKAVRATTDLTQEQVAERAEIDVTYSSMLERGLRAPNLFVIVKLGIALDIPAELLVAMTVARLRDGPGVESTGNRA